MNDRAPLSYSTLSPPPPALSEIGLLELFAPTGATRRDGRIWPQGGDHSLWQSDAIHRARNLAQLSLSLASFAERTKRDYFTSEMAAQVRGLSRVYDALALDEEPGALLPCAEMLREIVARLTLVFGSGRRIVGAVSADAVALPADKRRALLLICSELIINVLKYGCPDDRGCRISVSLQERCGVVELVVEDDGAGLVDGYAAGSGGGLVDRLAGVLGATVTRAAGRARHGFRVSVRLPGYQNAV